MSSGCQVLITLLLATTVLTLHFPCRAHCTGRGSFTQQPGLCISVPPHHLQVDAVLGDRRPTLDDIRALGFTTRCLNESMRLYPQPPVLIRRALEDDIVGGYRVGAPRQFLGSPCKRTLSAAGAGLVRAGRQHCRGLQGGCRAAAHADMPSLQARLLTGHRGRLHRRATCWRQVEKDADIFISVWNLHRSPEYWERPNEFDPTRFDLAQGVPNETTHNFAYLPFGGGRRKCIGVWVLHASPLRRRPAHTASMSVICSGRLGLINVVAAVPTTPP